MDREFAIIQKLWPEIKVKFGDSGKKRVVTEDSTGVDAQRDGQ